MKERVGILTRTGIFELISEKGTKSKYVSCNCDCGNPHKVNIQHWNKERIKSCGCQKYKSLIGKSFGRLTVISETEKRRLKSTGEKYWKCKCICGNFKDVATTDLNKKNSKGTQSCGCISSNKDLQTRRLKRVFTKLKSNAKKRKIEFELNEIEVSELINRPCFYCNSFEGNRMKMPPFQGSEVYIEYMGLDRKDSSICYTKENAIPCCFKCNTMKNRMTFKDYLKKIAV